MSTTCNHSIPDAKEKRKGLGVGVARSRRALPATRDLRVGCRSTSAPDPKSDSGSARNRVTTVAAHFDVGFGNNLFIRGAGNGLSWNRGQKMTCIDGATWIWSGEVSGGDSEFKLLINDQVWCLGANFKAAPGAQVEITPAF